MKKKNSNTCNRSCQSSLDFFPERYEMSIDKMGTKSRATGCGTFMSIMLLIAISAFSYYRVN